MIFTDPPTPPDPLRRRLRQAYRADETASVEMLLSAAELPAEQREKV